MFVPSKAPDEWLLASYPKPWWYRASPRTPSTLVHRAPNAKEQVLIAQSQQLLASTAAKAIALFDGRSLVWVGYKQPAHANSLFMGFSLGKAVTAAAIGKAICAGFLAMDTRAEELVPQLKGTALGRSTTRELLCMSSGAPIVNADSTFFTERHWEEWNSGSLDLVRALADPTVAQLVDERGTQAQPHFAYKAQDPIALGLMMHRATGVPYVDWVHREILTPMGLAHEGILSQTLTGHALADAPIRMRLEDWVRFARWLKSESVNEGQFGDFLREATKTQVSNSDKRFGPRFDGYGYMFWTDNNLAPATFWATGMGGQRIGWSYDNDRMLIAFSNREDWMDPLHRLYKAWSELS